jgi:hypothetical protein
MKDAEPKDSNINRRDFLKIVIWSMAGVGVYGLWRLNYNLQRGEKQRKMNEWEPQVANLLRETLESEELDNLKVFTEIARPQFVDLVSRSENSLLSPTPSSNSARYNLLAFALGEHYGLKFPSYGEGAPIPFDEDTLSFLDQTITRIDPERIRVRDTESQSNMWVEALYRSYAAAWEIDPTMKDGVYLPENLSLLGRSFAPNDRFVRLQPHT